MSISFNVTSNVVNEIKYTNKLRFMDNVLQQERIIVHYENGRPVSESKEWVAVPRHTTPNDDFAEW